MARLFKYLEEQFLVNAKKVSFGCNACRSGLVLLAGTDDALFQAEHLPFLHDPKTVRFQGFVCFDFFIDSQALVVFCGLFGSLCLPTDLDLPTFDEVYFVARIPFTEQHLLIDDLYGQKCLANCDFSLFVIDVLKDWNLVQEGRLFLK